MSAPVHKSPKFAHASNRQIIRYTIAPLIAKAQVRKMGLTGERAQAEIQAEIDAYLRVLSELNGTEPLPLE